jgi:hypothetical protein
MKRVGMIVLLLGLAVILADCSRCSFPTWGSRVCHGDAPSTQ